MENLFDKLAHTPDKPGVYLMKNDRGHIIYIGKAQSLRKRLASYFGKGEHADLKTGLLIQKISTFETIITGTDKEALILESNLIKRHKPRYNVILKDDKRYPLLRLDIGHPYPDLTIVRKAAGDGALYFGPYTSAQAVRRTLNIIQKTFKLRRCNNREFGNRSRPCLNYQMGACLAPCCLEVRADVYGEIVKEVILFLKGRTPDLIRKIRQDMTAAAEAQDFERAAVSRDKIFALERTLEKQVMVTSDFSDRDVLAIDRSSGYSLMTLMVVRSGYLMGTRHFSFAETLSTDAETIAAFIRQYYQMSPFIPKEIIVSGLPEDRQLIENWLKGVKGQKVNIISPQRGEKARLLEMALQNAQQELKNIIAAVEAEQDTIHRLQKKLKLKHPPFRIECFDNSSLAGKEPVGGMVVFFMGKPDKGSYRKYRLNTVRENDDYAYMAEVLQRRYGKESGGPPLPDLILIDGGKGQLNIASRMLQRLGLADRFDLVSIAKKDEKRGEIEDKIYKPGRVNPVNFGREDHPLLLFLQRIRDEAHRYAVSFHRYRRRKAVLHSILDSVPGIGQKRKKILLRHFKSINKIRAASPAEIGGLPGMNQTLAKKVLQALQN